MGEKVAGWTVGKFWREEAGVMFAWMPDNRGEIDGRISVCNL